MTSPSLAVHLSIEHFLVVGALLFALGLFTALTKKNAVAVLFGVELMAERMTAVYEEASETWRAARQAAPALGDDVTEEPANA